VKDLVKAVEFMTPEKSLEMRKSCEIQVKKFSLEEFEEKLKNLIY
jgi:hypothetical protein